MNRLVGLAVNLLLIAAVVLVIAATVLSLMSRNWTSIFYVVCLLVIVYACFPQLNDMRRGEVLYTPDAQQLLWWMFSIASVVEFANALQMCSRRNYIGALVETLIVVLLLSLALPYRKRSFFRYGLNVYNRR